MINKIININDDDDACYEATIVTRIININDCCTYDILAKHYYSCTSKGLELGLGHQLQLELRLGLELAQTAVVAQAAVVAWLRLLVKRKGRKR